jgi:hypothetical protein
MAVSGVTGQLRWLLRDEQQWQLAQFQDAVCSRHWPPIAGLAAASCQMLRSPGQLVPATVLCVVGTRRPLSTGGLRVGRVLSSGLAGHVG